MHVIDYSWARPDPHKIRAAGYTGVLRYVSRPETNGKNITKGELEALRAAGLDVTLNFEQSERRPLEGTKAGSDDAGWADWLADKVGYPRTCAIYYSVDMGTSWPSVRAYFQGVHAASKRPVGIYAGLPLCQAAMSEGLAGYGWITNAASWSGLHAWSTLQAAAAHSQCHLLQHLHSNTPAGIDGVADTDFDPNTVLLPNYGQWGSASTNDVEDFLMGLSDKDQLILFNNVDLCHQMLGWLFQIEVDGGWENRGKATPRTQQILALVQTLAGKPAEGRSLDPKELAASIAEALGPDMAAKVAKALGAKLSA